MQRTMLKSKIHRATVTEANLEYEGSIAIDKDLMKAANLLPFEAVDVYNITNGERLTTYVIEAPGGSGVIGIQGAAAHKAEVGHMVIICAYAQFEEEELETFKPAYVKVDPQNQEKING